MTTANSIKDSNKNQMFDVLFIITFLIFIIVYLIMSYDSGTLIEIPIGVVMIFAGILVYRTRI